MESDGCRIEILLVEIGPPHHQVEVVYPIVPQIVQEDGIIAFHDHGIEIVSLGGRAVQRVIVKGDKGGKIILKAAAGIEQDIVDLFFRIEIEIIPGIQVLTSFFNWVQRLFRRVFRGQHPVLVFLGFIQLHGSARLCERQHGEQYEKKQDMPAGPGFFNRDQRNNDLA